MLLSLFILLPLVFMQVELSVCSRLFPEPPLASSHSPHPLIASPLTNTSPNPPPRRLISGKLIHRNSIASPLHNSSLTTFKDRLHHAWSRSSQRASSLQKMGLNSHMFKSILDGADYGSGVEYLMEIFMGTPPQKLLVVADTGSSFVWLQCAPCQDCTTSHGSIYQPHISSTYGALPCNNTLCQLLNSIDFAYFNPDLLQCALSRCEFHYSYGDYSTAMGTLSSESLFLERLDGRWHHLEHFVFGCAHHSENDFFVSGLVGLGPRPYSLTSQLGRPNMGPTKFSYCLVSFEHSMNESSLLLFGDSHTNGMRYTPLLNPTINISAYYYVALEGISLGGRWLHIPKATFDFNPETLGGVILDTGTTFTIVPHVAYKEIVRTLGLMMPYPRDMIRDGGEFDGLLCYNVSDARDQKLPSFILHFKNMDLLLPKKNTYARMSKHTICLTISSSFAANTTPNENLTIIGNIAQQNFHIEFDLQNYRVGFLPTNCVNFASPHS